MNVWPIGILQASLAWVLCTLLPAQPLAALDPERPFADYVQDHWSLEQGMPQLSVLSMTQDATGYLWLTTQNGVARFDGVGFRNFDLRSTPELRATIIEKVLATPDGSLWFGSPRGLSRLQAGRWQSVDLAAGEDVAIHALLADGDGLLIGSDRGLYRLEEERVELDRRIPGPVRALARVGRKVYAGGLGVVHELDGGDGTVLALPLPLESDPPLVQSLLAAPDGLYAATRKGIWRLAEGRWERPGWALDLAQSRIEALLRDSDANFWIGTTSGLYRYHPRTGLGRAHGGALAATAWIASLHEDREGNLWVGSLTHSLLRLWNGWLSRRSSESGLADPFVWSVVADDHGRLWIGTNTGVERLDPDGSIHQVVSTAGLPDPSVYNLALDSLGQLWIGTRAGLARFDGQQLHRDEAYAPLAQSGIRAFLELAPGHHWIAASSGVYEFREGSLRHHGPEQGLSEPRTRALAIAEDQQIYVGTERGLYRGREGRFSRIEEPTELSRALVTSVLPWRQGRLLVGSVDAGLFLGPPDRLRQLTSRDGLPFDSSFALAIEGSWLYVSGPEGVYRIAVADLERVLADGGSVRSDMLVHSAGSVPGALRSRCCNGGAQARLARIGSGLWLPTLDGVLRLDAERIRRSVIAPTSVIEMVEHNGQRIDASEALELDGRSGDVAIHYSGLALQDPRGLRFRYRLLGYDERWRDAADRRIAYYTNLSPGRYRFEVQATSSAGLSSTRPASLGFRLVPPFYQTPWFLALAGLPLLALAWYANRWARMRRHRRERYLEEQVRQRTGELDRLNQRLRAANRALVEESQTDTLTGLRNRRFLARHMAAWRQGDVAQARRMALVLVDLDHFKRINDVHGHLAGDEVLAQLAEALLALAGDDGIALRWGGEEFMLVVPADTVVDAAGFCERIRRELAARTYHHSGGRSSRLTTSIGYAVYPALADRSDAGDWNLALELADAGLYAIKSSGRNGWAIVQARSRARIEDFEPGFGARIAALVDAGIVLMETGPDERRRAQGPPASSPPSLPG